MTECHVGNAGRSQLERSPEHVCLRRRRDVSTVNARIVEQPRVGLLMPRSETLRAAEREGISVVPWRDLASHLFSNPLAISDLTRFWFGKVFFIAGAAGIAIALALLLYSRYFTTLPESLKVFGMERAYRIACKAMLALWLCFFLRLCLIVVIGIIE